MRRVVNEVRRVGMNRYSSAILCILLLLLAVPTVNATITNWTCADDGDGAIVMNPATMSWTDNGSHDYTLSMKGAQYRGAANVAGDFTTDSDLDPTVGIIEDISNDTTFDWTDYHITIGMSHAFIFVSSYIVTPDGWTESFGSVLSGQPIPNGGTGWVGTVDYYIGTGDPVAMGDDGMFGFKVSFSGSTAFCTEQNPSPEPATIILLGLGAVSVIRRKRA